MTNPDCLIITAQMINFTWKLIVNEAKAMIFGKTKAKKYFKFIYNDVELELVHNFKYLGLIINFNGSLKLAITELKKTGL